jgi:hypothetical protein
MTRQLAPVSWQRNLLSIPAAITAKLEAAPKINFVAGVVKAIPLGAIANGQFRHLGIGVINDEVIYAPRVRPQVGMGRFSRRNQEGWEIVHKDLPMVTKTFDFDVPNYGDWSNGSHTVSIDRKVYQRSYVDSPDLEMVVEKLRQGADEVIFKLVVDFPLDRRSPNFADDLLFALNLLQENIGAADVLSRDANQAELLATLTLDWEIFPPGTVDEIVARTLRSMGRATREQETLIRERIALFRSLKPKRYIQGRGGMNRYIGALFADDLIVFENVRYGNALYVLYGNWEEISKRSRIDLLRNRDVSFERFVHSADWVERFRAHIRAEKHRRKIRDDDGDISFDVA